MAMTRKYVTLFDHQKRLYCLHKTILKYCDAMLTDCLTFFSTRHFQLLGIQNLNDIILKQSWAQLTYRSNSENLA